MTLNFVRVIREKQTHKAVVANLALVYDTPEKMSKLICDLSKCHQ